MEKFVTAKDLAILLNLQESPIGNIAMNEKISGFKAEGYWRFDVAKFMVVMKRKEYKQINRSISEKEGRV